MINWFDVIKWERRWTGRKRGRKQKKGPSCPTPNKKQYENHGHAFKEMRKQQKKTGKALRVYRCQNHYHISKRVDWR